MKTNLSVITAAIMITGCAALAPQLPTTKQLFNDYQSAYVRETRPSKKMIDKTITVRIRAYGDEEQKRQVWCKTWPVWCKPHLPATGMSVSAGTPEIWMDLRENAAGEIVINDVILGHEMRHTIKISVPGLADPDK